MSNLMVVLAFFGMTACRMASIDAHDSAIETVDLDGDGFSLEEGDCDDSDENINPSADEICDGVDNNCDSEIDENALDAKTYYRDSDFDGFGTDMDIQKSCFLPIGYSELSGDCDDADENINPSAEEICDGLDNNCDSEIDEDLLLTLYEDADSDRFGNESVWIYSCNEVSGYVQTSGDCNDEDPFINPIADEICDGLDNDCSGEVDDGLTFIDYYADVDGDTYGDESTLISSCKVIEDYVTRAGDCNDSDSAFNPDAVEDCSDPADYNCDGITTFVDADLDGIAACIDCNDHNSLIYPDAEEICDGEDNDCDGEVDEGVLKTFYFDSDHDGYGVDSSAVIGCEPEEDFVELGGDCNDSDTSFHPNASEGCDDSEDYNCDGILSFVDADSDGFAACVDCNDHDENVNPDAEEVCDGIDNDCNGEVDGVDATDRTTWYFDFDGDGYGIESSTTLSCSQPLKHAPLFGDCDDDDSTSNPGAEEICDGVDNNCNELIDDGAGPVYYLDFDGDGFGNVNFPEHFCETPLDYVEDFSDCDDSLFEVNVDAEEVCDEIDNNCDGVVDTDATNRTLQYYDFDGDGYGDPDVSAFTCGILEDYVINNEDCDDSAYGVNPYVAEICDNGIDDNCDSGLDEDDSTCPIIKTYDLWCTDPGNGISVGLNLSGDFFAATSGIYPDLYKVEVWEYFPNTLELADSHSRQNPPDENGDFSFYFKDVLNYILILEDELGRRSELELERANYLTPDICGLETATDGTLYVHATIEQP